MSTLILIHQISQLTIYQNQVLAETLYILSIKNLHAEMHPNYEPSELYQSKLHMEPSPPSVRDAYDKYGYGVA